MLQFFRGFFKSTIGVAVTIGLLGLIALAFAAGDVASSNGFGGIAGGDRAALVGKTRIGTAQLAKQTSQGFEVTRRENPGLTMKAFLARGGMEQVLASLLDRTALGVFGNKIGVIAGKRLVDSELAKIPALQGADGKFSDAAYRQLLAQRQLSDREVRDDISQGLIARQLLMPAQMGTVEPNEAVARYAAMLKEHREGAIAFLPSGAFAPKTPPTDAEIAAYYGSHRADYTKPERRVIRYAMFDASVIKAVATPTDADIAARYQAHKAQYAASESRKITQLILPTEAAAREVAAEVAKGGSLESAARAKGLATADLGTLTKDALAAQTSADIATAGFAAHKGVLTAPAKSPLGWHLLRVEAIDAKPARSLDQARAEITGELVAARRRGALTGITSQIEEEFDRGGALSDAAKEVGVTPTETEPLTSDGMVFGKPGQSAPKELARVVKAAFSMERENQAQLAELEPGKSFVIFDVTHITAAAPAPLAEIKPMVVARMAMDKGGAAARTAALKVMAQVRKGSELGNAIGALGVPLPPVQPVAMGREQLAGMGQKVPPPMALFFSMAQGTVKLLPAPQGQGWMVVQLKHIQPATIAANDPMIANVGKELSQLSGNEYMAALRAAIRKDVGVKRNEVAIKSVLTQLGGSN